MPMHVMDSAPSGSKWKLTQFLDNFSIPEATLFADILEVLCLSHYYNLSHIIIILIGMYYHCVCEQAL